MRSRRGIIIATAVAIVLLAAPGVAHAIPQYSNGWTFSLSGLRQIPSSVDTRAFCKGPAGTVYEVALGQTTAFYASMARIRVSDGKVLKAWTYPATPGKGVIPRAAGGDATGCLYVAVETQTGARDWAVVKFSRTGKKLWRRTYDSGKGADTPYGMVVDHHGNVIVAGTSEHTGGYDTAIVKWSSAGKRLWKRDGLGQRARPGRRPRRGRRGQRVRRRRQGRGGRQRDRVPEVLEGERPAALDGDGIQPGRRHARLALRGGARQVGVRRGAVHGHPLHLGLHGDEVHHGRQARLEHDPQSAVRPRRLDAGPGGRPHRRRDHGGHGLRPRRLRRGSPGGVEAQQRRVHTLDLHVAQQRLAARRGVRRRRRGQQGPRLRRRRALGHGGDRQPHDHPLHARRGHGRVSGARTASRAATARSATSWCSATRRCSPPAGWPATAPTPGCTGRG